MRRKEFSDFTKEEYLNLMNSETVCQIGLVDKEGYPRIVIVNFVEINGNVYFHGAKEGEKFDLFQGNSKVTCSVYKPFSYISSYFTSDIACGATIFFKSIHIRGIGSIVEDLNDKNDVVIKLMQKHQPEKKYSDIDLSNKKYLSFMKTTSVFKITPKEITMKQKFGQQLGIKVIDHIIEQLEIRNKSIDQETVKEIKLRRNI